MIILNRDALLLDIVWIIDGENAKKNHEYALHFLEV